MPGEKGVKKQSNNNLHAAKTAKNDEFYTQLSDIENELKHYKEHFKDKIVLCNCDDPFESNFFKFFALKFNSWGLRKLICTSYAGSKLPKRGVLENIAPGHGYKAVMNYLRDVNGDGAEDLQDVELMLQNGEITVELLEGDGDFASDECIELLKEADILVTNPPFSELRRFVQMLISHEKKFIIWGNNNAITYKEIFPLIQENKLWLGYCANKTCIFQIPEDYEKYDEKETKKRNDGHKYCKVPAISVFTNLDIPKRHEELILYKKYTSEEYPTYDNYDAINVDKVTDIPKDYCESWGVTDDELRCLSENDWSVVRTEIKDGIQLNYVIPAVGTDLRELLHKHIEGYKEEIERELVNSIYCNGAMGVPITYLDKQNPNDYEIVNANDLRANVNTPAKKHGLIKDKEAQITLDKEDETGHPRTEQNRTELERPMLELQSENNYNLLAPGADGWHINGKRKYARIFIQKIL